MNRVERVLRQYKFFADLTNGYFKVISSCATTVGFDEEEFVLKAGMPANAFYLIQEGSVSIEHNGEIIRVLEPGDVLGWSWLFPPFTWHFDARAQTLVRAVVFDGQCIRERCESDHSFGYHIVTLFSQLAIERLERALVLPAIE
ncbi:MAG: cyclic nucleotide-binding domain-containing protein [Chloroflexi bacterium]|nr:cyclic nucleotide-binding domain-containing protein [Chloroflexota bacterium]